MPQRSSRKNIKKRKTPRVSAEVEIQVLSGAMINKHEGLFTRQVGKNGCLVLGLEKALIGETIDLILKIDDRPIKISGEIVYRFKDFDGFCVGVKFTRISEPDKEYLSRFVDRCILKKAKIEKQVSPKGSITFVQISGTPHAIEIATIIKKIIEKEDIGKVVIDFRKADLEYLWLDDLATISSALRGIRTEKLSGKIAIIMNQGAAFEVCKKYFRRGSLERSRVNHQVFTHLIHGVQWLET